MQQPYETSGEVKVDRPAVVAGKADEVGPAPGGAPLGSVTARGAGTAFTEAGLGPMPPSSGAVVASVGAGFVVGEPHLERTAPGAGREVAPPGCERKAQYATLRWHCHRDSLWQLARPLHAWSPCRLISHEAIIQQKEHR